MQITIYTKEGCQPCKASKRLMTKEGLSFQEELITEANSGYLKAMGYMSAPVTVLSDKEGNQVVKWAGFQPDLIKAIKSQ